MSRPLAEGRLATVKGYALTDDDRLRADMIERLMCDFRVDLDAVCRAHGLSLDRLADTLDALKPMQDEGLVAARRHPDRAGPRRARPGARRRRLLRRLSAQLDPHPQPGDLAARAQRRSSASRMPRAQ